MRHLFVCSLLLALAGQAAPARAGVLNPLDFAALGDLSLGAGTYTIDTAGAPTLRDSGNNVLFSGVSFAQSVPAGSPFFGYNPSIAVFAFNSVSVAPGVSINVSGDSPLALLSHGSFLMDSTFALPTVLNASGMDSLPDTPRGGKGGPGGGNGGDAGVGGVGPGGGRIGEPGLGSRGGSAGFGGFGGPGPPTPPGVPYGDLNVALQAGSGGGGSLGDLFGGGAGGGGGGGAVELGAVGSMVLNGAVLANGGTGLGHIRLSTVLGGGGSGGGVRLHSDTITGTGVVSANGGGPRGGAGGSGGRILVLTSAGDPVGSMTFTAGQGSPFAENGVVQFGALSRATPNFVAELTTGSPAVLTQTVPGSLNPSPFEFSFDYLFQTLGGVLAVSLDGTLIDTLLAPGSLLGSFTTRTLMLDGSLFPGTSHILEFRLDGPTGSRMLLDNVMFPGLLNRDFQTGVIDPWVASGAGTVRIIPFDAPPASVPEPSSVILLGVGAAGALGCIRRRRQRLSAPA